MKKTVGNRIREARTAAELTQKRLAESVGVSRATVAQWENGDTKELKGENLINVAKALKLDPEYLATGKIDVRRGKNAVTGMDYEVRGIPIVGNTQGGPDKAWVEMDYPPGYGDEYIAMVSKDANAYALYVRGSSMAPRYREGDVILVEPNSSPLPDDDVVVQTTDGQVMVKTLVSNRNDQVILASIAEGHDRIVLRLSQIQFIHPVGATVPPRSVFKRKGV